MNRTIAGYAVFVGAIGMMLGLLGTELIQLPRGETIWTFSFIGKILVHISTVIGAYIAGQIVPTIHAIGGK